MSTPITPAPISAIINRPNRQTPPSPPQIHSNQNSTRRKTAGAHRTLCPSLTWLGEIERATRPDRRALYPGGLLLGRAVLIPKNSRKSISHAFYCLRCSSSPAPSLSLALGLRRIDCLLGDVRLLFPLERHFTRIAHCGAAAGRQAGGGSNDLSGPRGC